MQKVDLFIVSLVSLTFFTFLLPLQDAAEEDLGADPRQPPDPDRAPPPDFALTMDQAFTFLGMLVREGGGQVVGPAAQGTSQYRQYLASAMAHLREVPEGVPSRLLQISALRTVRLELRSLLTFMK